MINFDSDYMESCAPEILEKISSINLDKNSGYGTDIYCQSAKEKIRKACGLSEDAEIFFLVGGTQTNATVIKGILRNYEGVVSADTGHISVHEAGAIETNGHKVLTIPHTNGKINPTVLDNYLNTYIQMVIVSIWFTQVWSIFHTLLNMELFIQKMNWNRYETSVTNII